jgi:hypothetical protein
MRPPETSPTLNFTARLATFNAQVPIMVDVSFGSKIALRKGTSLTIQTPTVTAGATSLSLKTATLSTSPPGTMLDWCRSSLTKLAPSPSSSASKIPMSRLSNASPPKEIQDYLSGTRRTIKLTSLANCTLRLAKVAHRATMSIIVPGLVSAATDQEEVQSTPTFTARPGQLKNKVIGFLLPSPRPFFYAASRVECIL